MAMSEETLSSESIFKGCIVELSRDTVRLEDGSEAVREVIHHPGGVCVAAFDAQDCLLMVRQFRYPYKAELLEIPAGKREPGEDPAECGRRELEEETGAQAEIFRPLGRLYPTPGYVDEIIYLYYAKKLSYTEQRLDEGEFLSVERVPFSRALEMVLSGEILDAKTQVAVLKLAQLRQRGEV
ncbi:MAG: NUDIX hydrolase [Oscillospiraceae bacterium]|nr:NUDIX hydrolase [Oscillospiraceae bacterium]